MAGTSRSSSSATSTDGGRGVLSRTLRPVWLRYRLWRAASSSSSIRARSSSRRWRSPRRGWRAIRSNSSGRPWPGKAPSFRPMAQTTAKGRPRSLLIDAKLMLPPAAPPLRRVVQPGLQRGAHHVQGQRLVDAAAEHVVDQLAQCLAQLAQVVQRGIVRRDEIVERSRQRRGPGLGPLRLLQIGVQALQRLHKAPQRAQRQRLRAFGIAGTEQAVEGGVLPRRAAHSPGTAAAARRPACAAAWPAARSRRGAARPAPSGSRLRAARHAPGPALRRPGRSGAPPGPAAASRTARWRCSASRPAPAAAAGSLPAR